MRRWWVGTPQEVEERREHARRLVGRRLASVRYCEIDYAMADRPEGEEGPRGVSSEAEWREPPWRYDFGDCVDFGAELETACGRLFTVSWDSPGWHEGLWLREVPLIGNAVLAEANSAVWDVSQAGRWDRFIGHESPVSACTTGHGHRMTVTGALARRSRFSALTSNCCSGRPRPPRR
jgi:hypothetical protein